VDFSNDILNNVVSITGDAHQARVAQDIFRQEIRYERSLQIREDIRDQRKVMLESVTSYLYFGSIIMATCFVTVIEGYPPLSSNRMVILWWLLFAVWSITFELLAMWYALCFQVKLSQSARERLLRRYRYRLADDHVVDRVGGKNLVNTMFGFNMMVVNQIGRLIFADEPEAPIPVESVPESLLSVRVKTLDQGVHLDVTPLRKHMNAWIHSTSEGYAKPCIVDAPYYLLNETIIRCPWLFRGEKPLIFRVKGEATLYIAAQCPPIGGGVQESQMSMHGLRKALGADVEDWPEDELPVITAGFHPAWKGENGYGEMRRVEGASIFVDAEYIEIPIYKIVLAPPGPDGYVDVVVCWQFASHCEALCVVLRKGHVHCKEEDWPMAEFNDEIRQIIPLQEFSGLYLRRGTVCLLVNISFAVLSRLWLVAVDRPMWWLEAFLMALVLTPGLLIMYCVPINIRSTMDSLSMPMINRAVPSSMDASAPLDWSRLKRAFAQDLQKKTASSVPSKEEMEREEEARIAAIDARSRQKRTEERQQARKQTDERQQAVTSAVLAQMLPSVADDSPPKKPRFSDGRMALRNDGHDMETQEHQAADLRTTTGLDSCCVAPPPRGAREILHTASPLPPAPADEVAAPGTCFERLCAPSVRKPQKQLAFFPEERQYTNDNSDAYVAGFSSQLESRFPSKDSTERYHATLAGVDEQINTSSETLRPPFHRTVSLLDVQWCCPSRLRACTTRNYSRWKWSLGSFTDVSKDKSDSPILRILTNITRFLDVTFLLSVLIVLASPAVDWFREPMPLGPSGNTPEERRLQDQVAPKLLWHEIPVSWPPFLQPAAAAFDAATSLIFLASGTVIWTIGQTRDRTALHTIRTPLVLPEAVHGLGFFAGQLMAIGDAALYQLNTTEFGAAVEAANASRHAGHGLMDLAHLAMQSGSRQTPSWRHALGPVDAAALVETPYHGVPSLAAVIASRGRSVSFCAPDRSGIAGGELKVLAPLELPCNISALHISQGAGDFALVLWAAERNGFISALDLSTGRLLARYDALSDARLLYKQSLRGKPHLRKIVQILALAGNTTHLFMVADILQERPSLFCTPYPVLDRSESPLEL